jgi:predicted MFS family arabinose efflux permease
MTRPPTGAAVLFASVFAAQSALIALSPVLVAVADDFGVSPAAAGQLRGVAGLAAGLAAIAVPRAARRLGLRTLLILGSAALVAGSFSSAIAPSFAVLTLGQALVGAAASILVTTATTAAGEWAEPDARTRLLSLTLIGSPAAWIVGMPLFGLLGGTTWRYGVVALPVPAALAAAVSAARAPRERRQGVEAEGIVAALGDPAVRRWTLAELAANAAWLGLLVYAGALFGESYGTSPLATGGILAAAAAAFLSGNLVFRRVADGDQRRLLIRLALGLGALVALLGAVRPSPLFSAIVLVGASFAAGGRTLVANVVAVQASAERRASMVALRAVANQFATLAGAAAAGAALTTFGYGALGLVLGSLFGLAAATLMRRVRTPATRRADRRRTAAPAQAC